MYIRVEELINKNTISHGSNSSSLGYIFQKHEEDFALSFIVHRSSMKPNEMSC